MNPRSKKYHEKKQADDGSKKGSANKEGYNEENQVNIHKPNENPAPTKEEDSNQSAVSKNTSK